MEHLYLKQDEWSFLLAILHPKLILHPPLTIGFCQGLKRKLFLMTLSQKRKFMMISSPQPPQWANFQERLFWARSYPCSPHCHPHVSRGQSSWQRLFLLPLSSSRGLDHHRGSWSEPEPLLSAIPSELEYVHQPFMKYNETTKEK